MGNSLSTGKALAITGALFLASSLMILRPESPPTKRSTKTPVVSRKVVAPTKQVRESVAAAPTVSTPRVSAPIASATKISAPTKRLVLTQQQPRLKTTTTAKKQAVRISAKKNRSIASVRNPVKKLSPKQLQAQKAKLRLRSKPVPNKARAADDIFVKSKKLSA